MQNAINALNELPRRKQRGIRYRIADFFDAASGGEFDPCWIKSWPDSRFGQFSLGSESFQAWLCLVLARSARTLSRTFSRSREAALAARGFSP